jgi:hypothetical protein
VPPDSADCSVVLEFPVASRRPREGKKAEKSYWRISRIKGTPAAVIGRVEAADAQRGNSNCHNGVRHYRPAPAEPVDRSAGGLGPRYLIATTCT